jgi:adenosylcobinamide-phosphate synthase
MNRRAAAFGLALALDLGFGELPGHIHPVAWLGSAAQALARRLPQGVRRSQLLGGLAIAGLFPALALFSGLAVERATSRLPPLLSLIARAFALKQSFAVRSLFGHVSAVREPLAAADLPRARAAVGMIVSRPTDSLGPDAVASAAIESLTENASDSAIAPLAWYALGGLPAAYAYRAVNTLDAIFGYRDRGLFGMPSARLDDLLNLVPARVTALLFAAAAGRRNGGRALRGVIYDAGATPSPNSGWPMAAAAHALDVRLEKHGHHVLNASGSPPGPADIDRALVLTARAFALGAACLLAVLSAREAAR